MMEQAYRVLIVWSNGVGLQVWRPKIKVDYVMNTGSNIFLTLHVPPPIPGDRYADVFKNTYGTMQDYELHKELHQTRTTMIELERKFPLKFEQEYALKVKTYVRAINQSIQKTYQKIKAIKNGPD